jgi:hypothetical protein
VGLVLKLERGEAFLNGAKGVVEGTISSRVGLLGALLEQESELSVDDIDVSDSAVFQFAEENFFAETTLDFILD